MRDSLYYDIEKIARYKSDPRYDYAAQLDLPEPSLFDWLTRWWNDLLNAVFSGNFEKNVTTPVLIALFVLAIGAVLFFLFKKHPELFLKNRKTDTLNYENIEENFHRADFDKEISQALLRQDFRFAVRLKYLQTLRYLSDKKFIDWQIHKTPTEYLYEISKPEIRKPFGELTRNFLQVRYGNFDADAELYQKLDDFYAAIKRAGEEAESEAQ